MQKDENKDVKKYSRQEYQRLYYQKNKDRWKERRKTASQANVVRLVSAKELSSQGPTASAGINRWTLFGFWGEALVFIALIVVVTFFLVSDAAHFYLDAKDGPISAYVKASVIEVAAIAFSFTGSHKPAFRSVLKILGVVLGAFTLLVMSTNLVKSSFQDKYRLEDVDGVVGNLKAELVQKDLLRREFLKNGWLSRVSKIDEGIDNLRNQLLVARRERLAIQPQEVVLSGLSVSILFRLILVIINLVSIHRILEMFKVQLKNC